VTHDPISNWNNEDNAFVLRKPSWYKHAACVGVSGDIFFEEGVRRLVIEAKSYCYKCPVRIDCLEHAIKAEEIGIWGGMTTTERRREARLRRRIQIRGSSK
jgi:WhiB family redox-sensing transcriptional regulator